MARGWDEGWKALVVSDLFLEAIRQCLTESDVFRHFPMESDRIRRDPDTFRLSEIVGSNCRIRHPITSYRNPVKKIPTTSDGILSEVVGFLSEVVGLRRKPRRIRRDPEVGFLVLGNFWLILGDLRRFSMIFLLIENNRKSLKITQNH